MKRVDVALVERGLCASREKAQRAVLAGQVRINQQLARKPSDAIRDSDQLSLVEEERYVSRGGFKLEHALEHFSVSVEGLTVLDLGASTGGFTDCLLQRGAERVFAVDVGQGQLAWKLRRDPRVVVCSFISLRKILPPAIALLRSNGRVVALIKPQFEAGKAEADKGAGVITDPLVHERVLRDLREFVEALGGLRWLGVTASPLLGPAGNREFLTLLEKAG
jgi:23S rRNA (cytidine1920-2'-O)/16S rRNA (cytidine1409-2'-O)-methyltransferase